MTDLNQLFEDLKKAKAARKEAEEALRVVSLDLASAGEKAQSRMSEDENDFAVAQRRASSAALAFGRAMKLENKAQEAWNKATAVEEKKP